MMSLISEVSSAARMCPNLALRVRPMEGTQSCGQDLTLDSTLYLGNTHDFQLEGALVCCSAPFSEVHMVVTDRQLALLVTP